MVEALLINAGGRADLAGLDMITLELEMLLACRRS